MGNTEQMYGQAAFTFDSIQVDGSQKLARLCYPSHSTFVSSPDALYMH